MCSGTILIFQSQISSIGIEKENDSHSNVLNNDDIELTMTAQSSTFSNAVIDTPVSRF